MDPDPDPGGPNTYESYGSGSATLFLSINFINVQSYMSKKSDPPGMDPIRPCSLQAKRSRSDWIWIWIQNTAGNSRYKITTVRYTEIKNNNKIM